MNSIEKSKRLNWKHLQIYFLMLGLFAALGCEKSKESANTAQKTEKRQFLSVGTAPPGGAFFVVGGAIAQVVSENAGEYSWTVSAEATNGTQENIRRLTEGELDFAIANAAISYFAVRGKGEWEKEYPVRVVMTLAPNVALFITPKSSGVKKITDLKGKRVVVGPAGAGFEYFLNPILEAHGVSYQDFTPLYNTQAGAVDMLADGSAAAAFIGGAIPTASISQAAASQDIFFIPFEEQAKQHLIENYQFFDAATIPAGTYRGQDEPFHGLNVGSMHLITAANQDEEKVYRFTKILYEHRADVVKQHPAGKAINPQNVVKDTGTPFHPGAIRYYKEIGIWPEKTQSLEK
ncbi:TAXI family TRAP transporter solute-binding subunit [Candidatus Poribacteria bacterium]|nr:TAXI family TRAP transporter solute-binding subunit [Candidatus Poribacteria bacterium]